MMEGRSEQSQKSEFVTPTCHTQEVPQKVGGQSTVGRRKKCRTGRKAAVGKGGWVRRQGCCRGQRSAVSRKSPGRAWTPPC